MINREKFPKIIRDKNDVTFRTKRGKKVSVLASKESVISFVSFVPLTLSKFFFPSLGCTTGMTEVQPVIPLLLNTAINLARPIPSVQEYSSNPPPIPPPPEKYYASTEICKVSIQKKKKNVSRSRDP